MSTYRTLYAALPCARCGQPRETLIQFRTGEDNLESYVHGEVPEDTCGLEPGHRYPAHADWYCKACLLERKRDELAAFYETLAGFIDTERLILRQGLLFKKTVPSSRLLEVGTERSQQLMATGKASPLFSGLEDYHIIWDKEPLVQGTLAYNCFIDDINHGIAARLTALGWNKNSLIRRDLEVYLAEDETIRLEAPALL